MLNSIALVCRRAQPCCLVGALFLLGCGSGSNEANAASGSDGQVTDAWRDYCVATFTSDVALKDSFGDTAFTARKGEQYLLMDFNSWGGEPRVEIAYLTSAGPDIHEVPVSGGPETFPFTSNCTFDAAVEYYAVFADVKVYDTESLSTEICSLPAGTAVLRDMTTNAGYSATTLSFTGPQIYSVMLNALAPLCGGAETGYISVPQTTVLGVTTALVPIQVVVKPQ